MRRKDREIIDQADIIDFLNSRYVGNLSVMTPEGPYTIPLNYLFYDGCIYFHSALAGKKIEAIQNDNRVCFLVNEVGPQVLWEKKCGITQIYKSVICFWKAEIISDFNYKKKILLQMIDKFVPKKYNYSSMKEEHIHDTNIIKMNILKMSGKENKLSPNHRIIERKE